MFIDSSLFARDTFDREEQKEYHIPIAITDSGSPPLTGVSYLTLIIGDENDNPMKDGSSSIFVYYFKVKKRKKKECSHLVVYLLFILQQFLCFLILHRVLLQIW